MAAVSTCNHPGFKPGIGLIGMRQRVTSPRVNFTSDWPGKGTKVTVSVPFLEEE